ncbi:MAG: nucleoside triphosphate pyrophosphohydrolase [Bacteroidales bacterium]|nr:nucleoside triphosphate pyrophosphohydrolase [Bacteroidales bacterium]MBQ6872121.1 nucleoside triphosphate pyrophosphohydrolase [Bacteroidales bacterium]
MTKSEKRAKQMEAFSRILDVMDELREKCPWDREQTIASLRPMTIEETFELSDAILNEDMFNISKELGDLLLHVIFYAKIGEEQGKFDIVDVIDRLCSKLIYRHPHVYSTVEVDNAGQVVQNWEQLKTKEKDGNKTILSGVPESMPSMIKAYRMQEKASAVGFDWEKKEDVWAKVKEEIAEIEKEFSDMSEILGKEAPAASEVEACKARMESELGDLFFALINAARLYKMNPDTALESTNKKFRRRFTYLENETIRKGRSLKEMSLGEMDSIWDEAKSKGL